MIDHESWHTLMTKPSRSGVERALIQAVAALSVSPGYSSLTPEEVYDQIYDNADGLYA